MVAMMTMIVRTMTTTKEDEYYNHDYKNWIIG